MTGWVVYENGGMWTGHADILLSSRVGRDISDDLPKFQYEPSETEAGQTNNDYSIVGWCQKLVIVSDHFAFVWAGSFSVATRMELQLTATRSAIGILDRDELRRIADGFRDADFRDLFYSAEIGRSTT